MALFFDAAWFDAQLARLGLARSTIAAALGLGEADVNEIWKDQRELSAHDVSIIAALLGVTVAEVASRAGVSTPVPREAGNDAALKAIAERLERIEAALIELKVLVRERK